MSTAQAEPIVAKQAQDTGAAPQAATEAASTQTSDKCKWLKRPYVIGAGVAVAAAAVSGVAWYFYKQRK